MKIALDSGARIPVREHPTDAGLDLYALEGAIVRAHSVHPIRTGVHIELPPGTCGMLVSKSGLLVNNGITTEGLIDEGYSGEIIVPAVNNSSEDFMIFGGQKISQLIIFHCLYEPLEIVGKIEGGERGERGFGSTGV